AGPALLAGENRLILVAVAVRDSPQQAVAIDVEARQWNSRDIGRRGYQVGVLNTDQDGRPDMIVSFVHHGFAVTLVRGCARDSNVGHHVVKQLLRDNVFAYERINYTYRYKMSIHRALVYRQDGGPCHALGINMYSR